MASILSGARKYGLGLTLAHQDLRQLEGAREVSSAVLSNPGTRICFRLGDGDARSLESGFAFFNRQDLQSLGVGDAIARIDRADQDFNLTTLPAPEIDPGQAELMRAAVLAESRLRYAVPRSDEPQAPVAEPAGPPMPSHHEKPPTRGERPPPSDTSSASHSARADASGGRGGKEHTYLQQLIARMGQDRGFRATVEGPIPGSAARVDVVLERDGERIACEVSITSRPEYEAEKAAICLQADFDRLVFLCPGPGAARTLKKAILDRVGSKHADRISVLAAEALPALFDELGQPAAEETLVRGYRVKVSHRADPGREDSQRRITEVIARSLKRLKDD